MSFEIGWKPSTELSALLQKAQEPAYVDTSLALTPEFEMAAREFERATNAMVSPAGHFGLDAHLDARRVAYKVPDAAFLQVAAYNRVLVYQIPPSWTGGDTFLKGGAIHKVKSAATRDKETSPRVIIVSAGLRALDELTSAGMRLGDIGYISRQAPTHLFLDDTGARYLMQIVAGDLHSCEDTAGRIATGEIKVVRKRDEHGVPYHYYVGSDGQPWIPEV